MTLQIRLAVSLVVVLAAAEGALFAGADRIGTVCSVQCCTGSKHSFSRLCVSEGERVSVGERPAKGHRNGPLIARPIEPH